MKRNKKRAFTLVELLAVIVILAVILVIAIPRIQHVIENARKESIASSVKMLAASAESKYAEKEALGEKISTIECDDVSKLNDVDYETCTITFTNGKATVTIEGAGKFAGFTCSGTRSIVSCDGSYTGVVDEGTAYILRLYNNKELREENGLIVDETADANLRYVGAAPKNYVTFNNELWRIIGIFNVKSTEEGVAEPRIKLVRDESIGAYSWDSNSNNAGKGINQWGESTYSGGTEYEGADIMRALNGAYLNQESGLCCNGSSQNSCSVTCDFSSTSSIKGLDSTARNLVDTVIWNTGAVGPSATSMTASHFYEAERSNTSGKNCSSGTYCNDKVVRTTTWTGQVGLIYVSDFAYASTNSDCYNDVQVKLTSSSYVCSVENWLLKDAAYYALVPYLLATGSYSGPFAASSVEATGRLSSTGVYYTREIYPSVYLKPDVQLVNGDGSSFNPYELKI